MGALSMKPSPNLFHAARASIVVLAIALSACGGGKDDAELAQLDKELSNTAGTEDALTDPLGNQIVVDRAGAGKALKAPAPKATSGDKTLGDLAAEQASGSAAQRNCTADVRIDPAYAQKLPADLPLHPKAKLVEAGGNEIAGCRLRVVSFTVAEPRQAVIDWYYTKAVRAGFSAEHQIRGNENILGGTRAKDDGAYVASFTDKDGVTAVDLIAKNGV